jgi:hypothetical protein
MEHSTFSLREVLGCPVTDEFGIWQGQLADFAVRRTPAGQEPVDLVLRDGYGESVIPRPEALRLVRHTLTATIAASVRIRGDRDPADMRLRKRSNKRGGPIEASMDADAARQTDQGAEGCERAGPAWNRKPRASRTQSGAVVCAWLPISDLIDHRAVDLRHDRVIRVRDMRLTQVMGLTVVDAASVGPLGLFGRGEVEWVPWSRLAWLDRLLAGRPDAFSPARLRELSAVRLGLLLSQLTGQEREVLVRHLDASEKS